MRGLWRWLWTCLLALLLVSIAVKARGDEGAASAAEVAMKARGEEGFEPLPVCVRPPNVPKHVILWTYWAGGNTIVRPLPKDYKHKKYPAPTFEYDVNAPPENTAQLHIPYNTLPCDPKPPPPAPEEKPAAAEKKGEKAEAREEKKAAAAAPKEEEKKTEAPEAPPAPLPTRDKEPEQAPEWHPRLPEHGVTTNWPHSVLPPHEEVLPRRSVLPLHHPGDPCTSLLPMRGRPPVDRAQACNGTGEGNKAGKEKTTADKLREGVVLGAGIVNLQMNEDLKRPDGKEFGIIGGRNPEGPNNPFLQTAASAVLIAGAVLAPGTAKLLKRLASPAPLMMHEMEKLVGPGMAEEIVKKLGPKFGKAEGEAIVRACLADALEQKGVIGPYEYMKQFTDKLGGRWQAHHILEEAMVKRFRLGNADKVPSVILTEAEHKTMTARLAKLTPKAKNVEELWAAYQEAYVDHPTWLAAIQKYLVKGK